MEHQLAKALHIVGFVSWFSGLFYMVRLLVYRAEAELRPEAEREILAPQLELMARRLWRIITVPAMIVTLIAGGVMLGLDWSLWMVQPWLHVKLGFVLLLVGYHHGVGRVHRKQTEGTSTWTSRGLRILNEGATLLLVAIVFLAVFRRGVSALWGMGGLIALGVTLMLALRLYERARS